MRADQKVHRTRSCGQATTVDRLVRELLREMAARGHRKSLEANFVGDVSDFFAGMYRNVKKKPLGSSNLSFVLSFLFFFLGRLCLMRNHAKWSSNGDIWGILTIFVKQWDWCPGLWMAGPELQENLAANLSWAKAVWPSWSSSKEKMGCVGVPNLGLEKIRSMVLPADELLDELVAVTALYVFQLWFKLFLWYLSLNWSQCLGPNLQKYLPSLEVQPTWLVSCHICLQHIGSTLD